MKKILVSILSATLALSVLQAESKHAEEISAKQRAMVAQTKLQSSPDTSQVYVRGLICQSCGLGVRKKLVKLAFVNTKQPEKGVKLDVKAQLVGVSVKAGMKPDPKLIAKAVEDAGYDPILLYELDSKGKLKQVKLSSK